MAPLESSSTGKLPKPPKSVPFVIKKQHTGVDVSSLAVPGTPKAAKASSTAARKVKDVKKEGKKEGKKKEGKKEVKKKKKSDGKEKKANSQDGKGK